MGRNYSNRYINEQKRVYSKMPQTRWEREFTGRPKAQGPPENFQRAVLEWLDDQLSEVVKRNINFVKDLDNNRISLRTNPEYTAVPAKYTTASRTGYSGAITFHPDTVEVTCIGTGLCLKVEYANPQLFELLRTALTKFYNGVK